MNTQTQEVAPRAKKEFEQTVERTEAGTFFSPYTDIHETQTAVIVAMEVPGVNKESVDITLDKGVLTVKGKVDVERFSSLRPLYTEYNVGNFVRTFTVSTKIDSAGISASLADGVLTIELPKAAEAVAKRITVN